VLAIVGLGREQQDQICAPIYGAYNLSIEVLTGRNIAWRDPTFQTILFECIDYRQGEVPVGRSVAYENKPVRLFRLKFLAIPQT